MLGDLLTCYLFFGGAGAGACLVASMLALLSPREAVLSDVCMAAYRRLYASAYSASAALLFAGIVCLVFDMGRFDQAIALLTSPRPTHIVVGAYSLAACFIASALLAALWLRTSAHVPTGRFVSGMRAASALACAAAVLAMAYTGLLLQTLDSVPLWATPWLPSLFTASSASCGIAVAVLAAYAGGVAERFERAVGALVSVDAAMIVVEGVSLAFVVIAPLVSGQQATPTLAAAQASASMSVEGNLAPAFWVGVVGAGLVVPLALDVVAARHIRRIGDARSTAAYRRASAFVVVAAACALAGGAIMRFVIVGAGMHPTAAIG